MQSKQILIQIPNPCSEDWNKMTPADKGRFCQSCSKTVIDFTKKSDEEIVGMLAGGNKTKMCGHFRPDQLNRPMHFNVSYTEASRAPFRHRFAVAVFIAFGTMLFGCYNEHGKKIHKITVNTTASGITGMSGEQPELPSSTASFDSEVQMLGEVEIPTDTNDIAIFTGGIPGSFTVRGGPRIQEYVEGKIQVTETQTVTPEDPSPKDTALATRCEEPRIMGDMIFVTPDPPRSALPEYTGTVETPAVNEAVNDPFESTVIIFPNPSSGEFTVSYELPAPADVRISVLDANGRELQVISEIPGQHSGRYRIPFDLNDHAKDIYFVQIRYGERVVMRKAIRS